MKKKATELYKTIWRWHFYAGIFVAPFLIVLAITGGTYLFKPQIEQALYHSYYEVKEESTKMDADAQVAVVQKQYPEGTVTSFKPSSSPTRSSEVGLAEGDATYTVFLNPYICTDSRRNKNRNHLTNTTFISWETIEKRYRCITIEYTIFKWRWRTPSLEKVFPL